MDALVKANEGHVTAYGDDRFTESALEKFRDHFGRDAEAFFVFTGTAANVLGLAAVTRPFHAVICFNAAHLAMHECGGPEHYTGCKVITVGSEDGKLTTEQIEPHLEGIGDEHYAQPKVVSITQPTELGAVYTLEEIRILSAFCRKHDLILAMDGARLANAAAVLRCSLYETTGGAGVDVLSFGGTKNGMMCGESVVFFNREYARDFRYIRKQGMQLGAKMRYVSAQFDAYLTGDLWLRNARRANDMARYLAEKAGAIDGIRIPHRVESNALFPVIPKESIAPIQKEYFFYVWDRKKSQVRWMTSFDMEKEDIDEFAGVVERVIGGG
jgi:threonine aldolase